MARKNNLDKFRKVLFSDVGDLEDFSDTEKEQLLRYRHAFTHCLETPSISDTRLRDELIFTYNISVAQAYRDIGVIKILLPSVRNAGREWIRYIVNEELKKVIEEAKVIDGNGGLYTRILAIDKLAKYNKLDKEDELEINWDEIVPVSIEPTNDVSVLDVKPLENKEKTIKELYDKYRGEIEIEDVDYEEVKPEDERD